MKRGRPKNIVAGDASRVLASLAFGRRTVDELLEGRPQRHRFFKRLDADAHLVAVVCPVQRQPVRGRADHGPEDQVLRGD